MVVGCRRAGRRCSVLYVPVIGACKAGVVYGFVLSLHFIDAM